MGVLSKKAPHFKRCLFRLFYERLAFVDVIGDEDFRDARSENRAHSAEKPEPVAQFFVDFFHFVPERFTDEFALASVGCVKRADGSRILDGQQ